MLIIGNHSAHIFFARADLVKENRMWLATLYPYTSHKLQPLYRTVFTRFKRFYCSALANWKHPDTAFSIYSVAGITQTAFDLASTRNNILSVF